MTFSRNCELLKTNELPHHLDMPCNPKDEEIISVLTKVKGIGRWTAEMYLIFNLCRPDIFPAKDIGVIRGICECYNLKYPITEHHAIKLSKKWKPWRSVATWYLWRSLDPIPVEY